MKIAAVVQARLGSSRLPGKIMKTIQGKTILELQLERISRSKLIDNIIIATTEKEEDKPIAELAAKLGYEFFCGDELDLLARHYFAVKNLRPDAVIKIPSDCPLICPNVIDNVVSYFVKYADKYDFVSNLHPQSYPDGNDVEIMHFHILEYAFMHAQKEYEREHTTPYIWNHPHRFRIGNVLNHNGDYSKSHRFTIDYQEDFEFIKKVYDELYPLNPEFFLEDIMDLLIAKPEIQLINKHLNGVNWYRNHLNELKNI